MLTRVAGRVLLGSVVAVSLWMALPRSSVVGQPSEPLPPPRAGEPKFMGVASCASMACHHFNGPRASLRSEYDTWSAHDKHRQAFLVLYNERSERIVKTLYGSEAKHATKEELCLKCHASGGGKLEGDTLAGAGERFQLSDGVGCESCHGPAEKYLAVHYQRGFKELPAQTKKDRYGLENTKDLASRVEVCSRCHVGDASREVNHDLIAAGHPRLNFEPSAYHFLYNRHWPIEAERARNPDYEARLWVVGQLSAARSALDLLIARADAAGKADPAEKPVPGGKTWPEFAEYACFACHKELKVDSPQQKSDYYRQRHPGSFPYGTWYLTMLPKLTEILGKADGPTGKALAELRQAMERPGPRPAEVKEKAAAARKAVQVLIDDVSARKAFDVAAIRGMMKELLKVDDAGLKAMSWDQAAQLHMGLTALEQGAEDLGYRPARPDQVKASFETVRNQLKGAFKTGYDSPRDFDPAKLVTPFTTLRELLGN